MDEKLNLTLHRDAQKKGKDTGREAIVLIIILMVTLFNLFLILKGRGERSGEGLSDSKIMDIALRLEKQKIYGPAVEMWKDYLSVSKPSDRERAKVWYRIGKLYQESGLYDRALSAYYIAEATADVGELSHEISTRISECLERLGRFAALDLELKRRTSLYGADSSGSDVVVAEIGTMKITRSDLSAMIETEIESELAQVAGSLTPDQRREQKQKLLESILKGEQLSAWLQRLIAEELLYRRAREEGLGEREEIRRMLSSVERKLLAQKYLESEFAKRINISPDDMRVYYEAHKDEFTEDGKTKSFEDVKDEVYRQLRSERENEVQREVLSELMSRYDVVIHSSKLGAIGKNGEKNSK